MLREESDTLGKYDCVIHRPKLDENIETTLMSYGKYKARARRWLA